MGLRTEKFQVDDDGVVMMRMVNDTGGASVLGTAVRASSAVDLGVSATGASEFSCIGAIAEDGIANGQLVWVARAGPVQFLLEDGTAATRGYWVKTSDTQAGRVDATNQNPPGGGIPEIDEHTREVGHCAESKNSGSDVLCRVNCHFL